LARRFWMRYRSLFSVKECCEPCSIFLARKRAVRIPRSRTQPACGYGRRGTMSASMHVGRWAKVSLLAALAVAITGLLLRDSGVAPQVGGMLLAFGEAALVGGLADWFAVRALFAHPFGIPFPHSALIPRNRRRIVAEI